MKNPKPQQPRISVCTLVTPPPFDIILLSSNGSLEVQNKQPCLKLYFILLLHFFESPDFVLENMRVSIFFCAGLCSYVYLDIVLCAKLYSRHRVTILAVHLNNTVSWVGPFYTHLRLFPIDTAIYNKTGVAQEVMLHAHYGTYSFLP